MLHGFSVSLNPIGRWPYLLGAVLAVTALTLWAYHRRLKSGGGRWRYLALTLRLLALLLCLFAALRPTVYLKEKKKQNATIVLLADTSTSMLIQDEVRGQSRWAVGLKALEQAKEFGKTLGPELDLAIYGFDSKLSEPRTGDSLEKTTPSGHETDLGPAMLEAQKRQEGTSRRLARLVILSDFASNNGSDPLEAARRLKGQGVPVVTVGLGTENAGAAHKDIQLRDIVTSPTGFVKNHHEVRGSMKARGFANQTLTVELYVEGQAAPVAKTPVKVPDGADVIPITGVRFIPQTPGEKKITLKVAPQEGELIVSNNEISTVVTILSGGLNVLFLQGANFTWDYRFLMRAIERSPDIQVEGMVIRRSAQGDKSEIDDAEFTPGRYNVYILSDLPADYLTVRQHALLVEAVKKGAGFMMLGGRSSFGAGGWTGTAIEEILPAAIHPGDGELEPRGGIKFVPSTQGFDSYILQVGADRAETEKIWAAMPPILGANRFGERKGLAQVLATSPAPEAEPLMLSLDIGGRVIAYGGDTWVWARASEEGRLAHRKLWRQIIFWLSHKENDSENRVKLKLDKRRIAVGEKLDLSVTARDSKGAAIPNVKYETKVEREGKDRVSEPIELYDQGEESRGSVPGDKVGQPGDYTITTIARRDGQELGRDKARFIVYQDDRELENPSADLKLAREIAELTGGEAVNPERVGAYLKGIDRSVYTEYMSSARYEPWDNWPFLLIFTAILTLEWWLRKRHGWV
jgi:uncharacterized membrane protein